MSTPLRSDGGVTDATHLLDAVNSSSNHLRHSLSSEYQRFEQSTHAVRVLFVHVLVYYILAVAGYSYLVGDWSVVDSLYFATTLCTTIGFGDIAPSSLYGRLFTIFLALYGIVILGILLGMLGEYVVENQNKAIKERREQVTSQLVQFLQRENKADHPEQVFSSNVQAISRERSLLEDIVSLAVAETPILLCLLLVGLFVGFVEGWNIMDSIYWLVITGTTVGFGDIHPDRTVVKLFCVVFLPLAVAIFGHLLGHIASIYIDRKRRLSERSFLSRTLTLCDLTAMDTDANGHVDKAEFLSFMLVALQKVSKDDVEEILDLFRKLDVDGTNSLNKNDVICGRQRDHTL